MTIMQRARRPAVDDLVQANLRDLTNSTQLRELTLDPNRDYQPQPR
jgi:hypothetical protein